MCSHYCHVKCWHKKKSDWALMGEPLTRNLFYGVKEKVTSALFGSEEKKKKVTQSSPLVGRHDYFLKGKVNNKNPKQDIEHWNNYGIYDSVKIVWGTVLKKQNWAKHPAWFSDWFCGFLGPKTCGVWCFFLLYFVLAFLVGCGVFFLFFF